MIIDKAQLREFDKHFECDQWGKWSRYFNTKRGVESLGLEYKEGRGIKVFMGDKFSANNLKQYCIIKTYFAYYGLSPKVYNFGMVGDNYYIEIEDVSNNLELKQICKESVINLCPDWIIPYEIDLEVEKNYLNGYYLDFHGFRIDWKLFTDWFENKACNSHWGKMNERGEEYPYQNAISDNGKRDIYHRIKVLFNEIDFYDKTVLDIGCNLGIMSQYAIGEGASKVVGIDCFEDFKLLADIYKYYNLVEDLEFINQKLTPDIIDQFGKFDIVFFLAMEHSLGIPDKLKDITKELLIFEGHNLEDKDKVKEKFSKLFNKVEFIGFTTDRGIRPVFHCYK